MSNIDFKDKIDIKTLQKKRLDRKFFERDTTKVAKDLLGKYLVRKIRIKNGKSKIIVSKIVETEAYKGEDDLACHASKGRTNRTEIMYGKAGRAYIYMIYGMYFMLNIVTEKENFPSAVLIRAVEAKNNKGSGPGKLCKWMMIDKKLNGIDITKSDDLYISDEQKDDVSVSKDIKIVKAKRIGVSYAKHCADYFWRFYIKGNRFVSKK